MLIEIKNRYTDEIIISGEYGNLIECLEKNKSKLRNANLRYMDLSKKDRPIKSERMDYMEKGAGIGKPREDRRRK